MVIMAWFTTRILKMLLVLGTNFRPWEITCLLCLLKSSYLRIQKWLCKLWSLLITISWWVTVIRCIINRYDNSRSCKLWLGIDAWASVLWAVALRRSTLTFLPLNKGKWWIWRHFWYFCLRRACALIITTRVVWRHVNR